MTTSVNGLLHYNAVGHWLTTTPLLVDRRVILLMADSDRQIKNLTDAYRLWSSVFATQRPIMSWPEGESASPALSAIINNERVVIICHQTNLTTALPTKASLLKKSLTLTRGDTRVIKKFVDSVIALGYRPNRAVNKSLEIATRGNIVDIGLADSILRLEFDGTTVERIAKVDIVTQTVLTDFTTFTLLPVTTTKSDSNLLEYLDANVTVISESDIGAPEQIVLTQFQRLSDQNFNQTWPDLTGQNAAENIEKLKQQSTYQGYWLTKQTERADTLIKQYALNFQTIPLNANLLQTPPGWIDTTNNLIVINDNLIFTNESSSRTKRAFLTDITVGDLVVHRDHGVGKLEALTTIPVNGRDREYLILSYANDDKIYLPTDQAGKISKYVGGGSPKISRLSSDTTWIAGVKKIKAETWQLALALLNTEAHRRLTFTTPLSQQTEESAVASDFPFEETPSQLRTLQEVMDDLAKDYPTERLVCGDVGFGKTEIALRASWRVTLNKGQTALIAPTTLLAQQHYDTFKERLEKYGASIGLLSRWQTEKEQQDVIKKIRNGTIDIVIGTHRALSADVKFANLRLLIIDEEQNFGVKDKEKLKKIANHLHILSLSATPIPRTLHLAMSQLRGVSLLIEPPVGRQAIVTEVTQWNESIVKEALTRELDRQGQAYYLHNKVETIDLAASQLRELLPQARIGVAHGQMDDKQLAQTMHLFDQGEIDILVCSTIIANGLDLPNVNTIIITDCVNFGLGQLHQLRGRVGRGSVQAYCYLLYKEQKVAGDALDRLRTLESNSDLGAGFKIASRDMELRGVGHILGRKQHGHVTTLGLNLFEELLNEAVEELRTGQSAHWRDIDIDLPFKPSDDEYIFTSTQEKIHFWQKISWLRTTEELQEELQKLSTPSPAILDALYIQELKIYAQSTSIQRVTSRHLPGGEDIIIELQLSSSLTPEQIKRLISQQPHWTIASEQLKIKTSQLHDWRQDVLQAVRLLANR
jgi:transcription-repair coupling factor